MEFTLLGSAAIAVAGLYATLWWEARRGNAVECTRDLWDVALTAAIAGVFVGRVAAMVGDEVNPLAHPGDLLIIRAGVATGWASAAALSTAAVLGRRELWPVLDGLAAASLAGLAGWHAGCLTRDACLGTPSDLPWAMTQAGSTITRHPVELYAAVALAIAALVLVALRRVPSSALRCACGGSAGHRWDGAASRRSHSGHRLGPAPSAGTWPPSS